MKKNRIKTYLSLVFVASVILLSCAFTTFRGETGTGAANVVSALTPIDTNKGGTIWTRSFSDGRATSYNSIPILTKEAIYIVNANQLYELDYNGNILRQYTLSHKMNSVCNVLLHDNILYIPLNGGIMEAVDITTMKTIWISEQFGGQSLATTFYYQGYLYSGTTTVNNNGTSGTFYCLNASDGTTKWTYEDDTHPGGYYWSGGIVHNNALYFCGDNGKLISHSLLTDEIYDTYTLTDNAKIRAGITYDDETDALYTISNDGTLYQIFTNNTVISKVNKTKIAENITNCTSTPTIYNNRIYVGGMAGKNGIISVLNATNLSVCYTVTGAPGAEIKSSPLVSTRGNTNGSVYVYVSANASPGGVYYFADTPQTTAGILKTLYLPAQAKQYCLSSIVAGDDGTLYYSNDSGTLFAVYEVVISSDRITTPTPIVSPSPSPSSTPKKTTKIKVKKPTKVKIKRGKKNKKKYMVSWKKNTKKSQTVIYIKKGSGKWSKKIIKAKTNATIIKKGKKKYRIRLRSRLKKSGKWYYSAYTKTFLLK